MSELREQIATRIHSIYIPNDSNCSFTDKDWVVAGEIEQLQSENQKWRDEELRLLRRIEGLIIKNKELKRKGTNIMLALEDVVDNWDDENWPDNMGWSKLDCERICKRWESEAKE